MGTDTPTSAEIRAKHQADIDGFREAAADYVATLRSSMTQVRQHTHTRPGRPPFLGQHARILAANGPLLEEAARLFRAQASSFNGYFRHHSEDQVDVPDLLGEMLARLTPAERLVYEAVRLGPKQAARALERAARP